MKIKGPFAVQTYLVNGVQEVYRSQGITINKKHIEVIVRQTMRRVQIGDPPNTTFLCDRTLRFFRAERQNLQ